MIPHEHSAADSIHLLVWIDQPAGRRVQVMFRVLMFLSATAAAPFIYTLFYTRRISRAV